MSDGELTAFLKYAALAPIRFGSSSCSTRFPDLKDEADGHVERFATAHAAVLKAMDEASRTAFARSFGDTAVKRRDARIEADSASTFGRIERYSRDECKSHLASIEGFGQMSDTDLDATLAAIARQSFEDQRAAVPACG
jgi:hypothetical protein